MNTIEFSSGDKPSFSVVLVNYKTLDMTKICLELLHEHLAGSAVPVWVVDNYSADESTEYLRSLDWIRLIERPSPGAEQGHMAHGRALDLVLNQVETDFLLLLHTDTFIFDQKVFSMMLNKCVANANVAAVGCTEQINRGLIRSSWRFASRLFKHYFRRMKISFGLKSRDPKFYRETHLKSFCTLWNCKLIKKHGLRFLMDDGVPGYTLQDMMVKLGHDIVFLRPSKLFKYLDHAQSGTVAAAGGYGSNHRRTKTYENMLNQIKDRR
ncbi:glycosyltransferase family 2 protein [Pseudomonas sp. NPDC098747]|uniref:glycosyltransferase family 2 protein n=1 Tax=Pseudomonas sp. NPDC098747 TaxID=3364487 RepID=UPI00383B594B